MFYHVSPADMSNKAFQYSSDIKHIGPIVVPGGSRKVYLPGWRSVICGVFSSLYYIWNFFPFFTIKTVTIEKVCIYNREKRRASKGRRQQVGGVKAGEQE